ncbi:MAG: hypothetical protein OK457_09190, partial [Thaumarchaeota archaeon]|nr:hypothetical protein [Nitrososphaerota archaeon]
LKPRWIHPLNFREQDKEIMDAAILLAKREGSDLTNVIRDALKEYTASKLREDAGQKLDSFISDIGLSSYKKLLSPEELKIWRDAEVLDLAKSVRARKQELEFELTKRGYYFRW